MPPKPKRREPEPQERPGRFAFVCYVSFVFCGSVVLFRSSPDLRFHVLLVFYVFYVCCFIFFMFPSNSMVGSLNQRSRATARKPFHSANTRQLHIGSEL